jgi:hypothetical protein
LSATLTWPSTRRWRAAKADTMWIAAFAPCLVGGAAQRLAVDGDYIRRHPDQLGDPGDEATLEFRGVERRENVAEVVVRRRSIVGRQKPAQKRDLLLAEPCNIDEGFWPGEHCEQAQQQHLTLPRCLGSGKSLKQPKKQSLRRTPPTPQPPPSRPRQIESGGSRQIQHFSRLSRATSPDYPVGGEPSA